MRISDWSSDVCSSDLAKRKFIGKTFIDIFEDEAKKIGGAEFLAQGTLYPDVIESVSFTGGPSVTIKSHQDRKSVVSGKSVSVRVDLGGRRIIKKKKK